MQAIETHRSNPVTESPREQKRTVRLRAETIDRLEQLREERQSYDDLVTELIDIYEMTEWSLAHSGDAL